MAARNPDRDKALEIYKQHKGNITNREIAAQIGIPERTISTWKARDKWNEVLRKKRSTSKRAKPTEAAYFQKLNETDKSTEAKNSKRHEGGQPGNQNAKRHGLLAKYLPAETLEIVNAVNTTGPIEILWQNIQIQYAAILRAQQIMLVKNAQDMTKEISSQSNSISSDSTSYDIQYAWDKQAKFLLAQSRAMTTLNSMIKQYDELTRSDLATEEQRMRIEKLKAEIASGQGDEENDGVLKHMITAMKEGLKHGH